jgi:hypothetical protein
MPPTRLGHISTSSIQPGAAAHPSSTPMIRIGIAPLPWAAISAPTRKTIWLDPPMAKADVPSHPIVCGCSRVCAPVDGLNGAFIQSLRPRGPKA